MKTTRLKIHLLLTFLLLSGPVVALPSVAAENSANEDNVSQTANVEDGSILPHSQEGGTGPTIDPKVVQEELAPIFKMETPQLDKRTPQNTILTGGVEHPEMLQPAPKFLQGGVNFDNAEVKKVEIHDTWYRIPDWLAGRWESNGAVLVYDANFRTGKAGYPNLPLHGQGYDYRGIATLGWQQDVKKGYWQYERFKNLTQQGISRNGMQYVRVTLNYEPSTATANELVMQETYTLTMVDPKTQKVVSTKMCHVISKFIPLSDGKLVMINSTKSFDEKGKPLEVAEWHLIKKRIAPYQRINFLQGKDLRESFKQYLDSHNLSELVPQ